MVYGIAIPTLDGLSPIASLSPVFILFLVGLTAVQPQPAANEAPPPTGAASPTAYYRSGPRVVTCRGWGSLQLGKKRSSPMWW